jgi:iron complex transport system substrate-binding protein
MRIVSLISAATEMLFALELGDQVVGISHECDWPPECATLPRVTQSRVNSFAASAAIDAEVKSRLSAGEALYEIDVDLLSTLQPDLIVTQSQCDVCAVRYDDVISTIRLTPRLAGTQVLSLNPQSLVEVFDDMRRIAAATNISKKANEVLSKFPRRIERVRSISASVPVADRPRVAVIEWLEPLMLAGNWVPELVDIAGGKCELTPPGRHSQYHDWNALLQFDPQAIVVCPCGFDLPRATIEAATLCSRPGWYDIAAVKTRRVFIADGNACFNRPGPRLVESTELLAGLLHPERHQIPGDYRSLFCQFE